MATLVSVAIDNYRSIQGPLRVDFPENQPVVLLGENNTGKSNIVKAVNLLLGGFWPGSHDPEDHEFYHRDRTKTICLTAVQHDGFPWWPLHEDTLDVRS
jgi:putative ATP-dependent endonuclease of OLD family